jgi:AraC family transcriptional regulator
MEPRIVRRPAFRVVGMAGQFTPATTSRVPVLWESFVAAPIASVPHRRGHHTLGVCAAADATAAEPASFTYVAAVEVERIDDVPSGLIALTIPECTYAVFTHSGHISRLPDTVKQVFGEWLPSSPYAHVPTPDFELYDERWDPTTGEGDIDIYVPIAESGR